MEELNIIQKTRLGIIIIPFVFAILGEIAYTFVYFCVITGAILLVIGTVVL